MNNDIYNLSMADEDDYDEYEEEVIERDEEYDTGEEEYDDEEYEDEDYDDEEYEDEEPYDDEEYDEGYDDQYYDDRLNQVLDELAELKRNMTPAAVQQQPVMQQPFLPIQPHMMFGMPQNNDVVMYNEISRLRDELSKTQNSQTLHEELSRLKDDMEREKKHNEAQFLSEIKRLNERIEELQAPEKSKAAALPAGNQAAGYLPEAPQQPALPHKEFGKLVGINETLLKSTRDSDARIIADIAELKTKLEAMSGDETVNKALADIREAVKTLEERPACVNNGEAIAEISSSVAALKSAVDEHAEAMLGATASLTAASNENTSGGVDRNILNKLARIKTEGGRVDLTEIMRSVYELKGMLGSGDANQQELVNMALKAYTELDLLHATIANSNDFRTKLEALENFVSTVNAQDFITADALTAYNIVLKELMDTPLDRSVFDSLNSFASATGKITVSSAKKEAVNRYISFAERSRREDVENVMEFLPEMASAINDAEGAKNVSVVNGLRDEIVSIFNERKRDTETDKHAVDTEIKALISELTNLTVGDIVSYSPEMPLPTSDAMTFGEGDSVSDRINSLMQSVAELGRMVEDLAAAGVAPRTEEDGLAATAQPRVDFDTQTAELAGAEIEELRAMLAALDAKINIDELSGEVQRNFDALSGRLADIESRLINTEVPAAAEEVYPQADEFEAVESGNGISEEIAEQIAEIKEKLAEQDVFVSQITDLRTDILALPETVGQSGQFDKLYDDIVAQFDKLYEDLSAVDGDTSEKLQAKLDEIKAVMEGLAAADMSAAVIDSVVDFRTAYEDSQALSAADRAKLLEDVAFVREGVERRLNEQAAEAVGNKELSEQIETVRAEFGENLKTLEERIATIEVNAETAALVSEQAENIAAALDERFAIQDENAAQILDGQQGVAAALEELKEKSAAIEDLVNTNGLLLSDNQNSISERVNKLLELLMPPGDKDATNIYDEIISISTRVNEVHSVYEKSSAGIRDSLAEIKEQIHLKELEQSIAAIPATEEDQAKLLSEITELRERLGNLENSQQLQSDTVATQLDKIAEQITSLSQVVATDNSVKEASDFNVSTLEELHTLIAEVADIKDKLSAGDEQTSEIVRMQDDITFIRNQIEANIETAPESDPLAETLENEGLSLIMDDIAAIKEKIATLDEYDTVAEILSLREDVKTARLLDNGDVAAELEGLKGDLLELKADISDIKTLRSEGDGVPIGGDGTPTSDEVNMLLSEIVSLRDEIQAYKDDVAGMVSAQDDVHPVTAVADENISVILDELTGLHNEIDNLKMENLAEQAGEIDEIQSALSEIKDMISRRTTLAEDGGAARENAVSNELNVVLDEIINVKSEVAELKADFTDMNETAAAARESDAQADKAALADEMQTLKSELFAMIGEKLEELSLVSPDYTEELQSVKDQLADLQTLAVGGAIAGSEDGAETGKAIFGELNSIKEMISSNSAVTMEELYGEVLALRQEMEESRAVAPVATESATVSVDLSSLNEQLAEIREQLMNAASVPAAVAEPDEAVLTEVLSLREEIAALREEMSNMTAPEQASSEPDELVLNEVMSLREEIAELREQMNAPAAVAETETDATLLNEILGLREEMERMRENGNSADDTAGIMESIDSIKEDVRAIKEEPDLSIINEVLALRDEFQAFKDELDKTRTAPAEDKSKEELISEVQSLRDQLFAISMANVNDGTSNEVVYESYNNIILDEISSLRDELAVIKQSDETNALGEELAQMKDRLTNLAIDDSEKTEARFDELREEIARLKQSDDTAANDAILSELAALKEELYNQREADATTLNFMSEMARLIERQNAFISQASNERLSEEIESLKSEIASSLAAPATSEDLRSEIESLKAELGRNKTETVTVDNSAVLREIAALRKEMDSRNSSEESKKILREISVLKNEIGAMAEREPSAGDEELSRSISDLKAELNQLAGIVEEEAPAKPAARKNSSQRAKSGAKNSGKGKSGAKRGNRPKAKPAAEEDDGLSSDTLLSKIDSTSINLGGSSIDETIVLNPNFEPEPIPATSEEMDIASRIAKQVANKLIMEQLVQQLGDGNVPHSEVEEIVKDILPQEFTTIQVDEQTDRVRRLANSLVLDKLRSRLKK